MSAECPLRWILSSFCCQDHLGMSFCACPLHFVCILLLRVVFEVMFMNYKLCPTFLDPEHARQFIRFPWSSGPRTLLRPWSAVEAFDVRLYRFHACLAHVFSWSQKYILSNRAELMQGVVWIVAWTVLDTASSRCETFDISKSTSWGPYNFQDPHVWNSGLVQEMLLQTLWSPGQVG